MSFFIWSRNLGKSEQGIIHNRYSVIPRVLIFLFDSPNSVLLIRGAKGKKLWAGKLNGIGGHVEKGESISQAAERELLEETGLTCEKMLFCGQIIVDTGMDRGIAIFIFKAENEKGKIKNSVEGIIDWHDVDALHADELVSDLPTLLLKVSQCQRGCQPFWGLYYYDENDELVMVFD